MDETGIEAVLQAIEDNRAFVARVHERQSVLRTWAAIVTIFGLTASYGTHRSEIATITLIGIVLLALNDRYLSVLSDRSGRYARVLGSILGARTDPKHESSHDAPDVLAQDPLGLPEGISVAALSGVRLDATYTATYGALVALALIVNFLIGYSGRP